MSTKEKAADIYKNAMYLHGLEAAKHEALNSAHAIQALVPFDKKEYWNEVIKQIQLK
jgi:sensor histidine kinase regulating citrate/malate metabolism